MLLFVFPLSTHESGSLMVFSQFYSVYGRRSKSSVSILPQRKVEVSPKQIPLTSGYMFSVKHTKNCYLARPLTNASGSAVSRGRAFLAFFSSERRPPVCWLVAPSSISKAAVQHLQVFYPTSLLHSASVFTSLSIFGPLASLYFIKNC